MFEFSFHEFMFFYKVRSSFILKGPFSANKAVIEEQPGPPVNQNTKGS